MNVSAGVVAAVVCIVLACAATRRGKDKTRPPLATQEKKYKTLHVHVSTLAYDANLCAQTIERLSAAAGLRTDHTFKVYSLCNGDVRACGIDAPNATDVSVTYSAAGREVAAAFSKQPAAAQYVAFVGQGVILSKGWAEKCAGESP